MAKTLKPLLLVRDQPAHCMKIFLCVAADSFARSRLCPRFSLLNLERPVCEWVAPADSWLSVLEKVVTPLLEIGLPIPPLGRSGELTVDLSEALRCSAADYRYLWTCVERKLSPRVL